MGKSKKLITAFGIPAGEDQNSMTDVDREHLIGNIVSHLGGAQKRIQLRQTALFCKADPECGQRVAEGLGPRFPSGKQCLNQKRKGKETKNGSTF